MKSIKRFATATAAGISGLLLSVSSSALAQVNKVNLKPGGESEFNRLGDFTLVSIITTAIRFVLVVAAVVFFFMLVIGGVQWITAGGDKTGAENARKRITSALIGLAIVFIAWAIVWLVNQVFGINIFGLNIPQVPV